MNHAQLYADAKGRIVELVESADIDTAVPACPGWTVKDLIAHLAGGLGDFMARRFEDAGSPEWGERQVRERRDRSLEDDLAEWDDNLAGAGSTLESPMGGVIVTEIVLHEHDIRGALGRPGERRSPAIEAALASPLGEIDRRIREKGLPALLVVSDEGERRLGESDPEATLRASSFELLRAISGRRSADRLVALDWSGDPTPYLEVLGLFGTARSDLDE